MTCHDGGRLNARLADLNKQLSRSRVAGNLLYPSAETSVEKTSFRPFFMIMRIEAIAKSVYGFFGAVFLIVGATVLLLHTGMFPN
jgi:hypothetical protein